MKPEKIVVVGAEGGRITLFGWKSDQGEWHFLLETDERSMMDILSEEDQEGLCFYSKTEAVIGWREALKLLNKYPWPCLYPIYVHPEFSDSVMIALKDAPDRYRVNIDFRHWDAVCAGMDGFDY